MTENGPRMYGRDKRDISPNLRNQEENTMGCFYCDEHHEGREAIMFKVGEMKAGTLYLFKDQAHKGRCVLALKSHHRELWECEPQERADFAEDLARASKAIQDLWGCKIGRASCRERV